MDKTVSIFSAHFYPHLGGIEKYTQQIAKELINIGYNVNVFTCNTNLKKDYEIIDGVKVYRLPTFNFMGGRLPFPKYNKKFKKIIKMAYLSDFYIINARYYFHSIIGAYIASKRKKHSILIDHSTGHFVMENRFLDFFGHIYEHVLTFILKLLIKEFYGVSKACNLWLKHFKITSTGVIYNGIETNYIVKNKYLYIDKYKLGSDSIIISYAGRLIIEKGILNLIDAFLNISKEFEYVYLFIAGDGPIYNKVKEYNSKKIFVLGKINYDEVMNLFSNSRIFVLPTDYPEGLPTSILEAAINRCSIISTSRGGTPEVIINNNYGKIMINNSSDEIYKSIKYLLLNEKNIKTTSDNIFELVEQNFSWKNIVQGLSKIIELNT